MPLLYRKNSIEIGEFELRRIILNSVREVLLKFGIKEGSNEEKELKIDFNPDSSVGRILITWYERPPAERGEWNGLTWPRD